MSGRLWTPNDQLRFPAWQVWLATKQYRPDPNDHAEVYDWEVNQLKTSYVEGDKYKTLPVLIDRHIATIASFRLMGMSTDQIAVAFSVTRQCIEKRLKKINCDRPRAIQSSETPVLQV